MSQRKPQPPSHPTPGARPCSARRPSGPPWVLMPGPQLLPPCLCSLSHFLQQACLIPLRAVPSPSGTPGPSLGDGTHPSPLLQAPPPPQLPLPPLSRRCLTSWVSITVGGINVFTTTNTAPGAQHCPQRGSRSSHCAPQTCRQGKSQVFPHCPAVPQHLQTPSAPRSPPRGSPRAISPARRFY